MDQVRSFQIGADDIAPDSEPLILVDEADREVGHMSKAQCHQGGGVLHRAFSLLIFNDAGELLLQSSPTRRDHGGGYPPAPLRGAGLELSIAFSVQVQVPGAIRYGWRRARAVLGLHRALHRAVADRSE